LENMTFGRKKIVNRRRKSWGEKGRNPASEEKSESAKHKSLGDCRSPSHSTGNRKGKIKASGTEERVERGKSRKEERHRKFEQVLMEEMRDTKPTQDVFERREEGLEATHPLSAVL